MTTDNTTKDVLEQNVETLIESGGEAPKLNDLAKARIRAKLVAAHGADVPARKRRPLVAVGVGLAATAAAALIVTRVVGGGPGGSTGGNGEVINKSNALADGSTWISEPGAKVTVLGKRHVKVEGAALLDVVPGKGTFIVETQRGRIEVLGTRFLVAATADRTTTAVVRGSVKLASPDGAVTLHAGEQGVAEPGRPPSRGPAPRLSHLVSWAAQARHREEKDVQPIHRGTLFARDPGVRSHPPWGPEYPLPLKKLGVDVVVENQVARVALDQTFHNDADQTLEGVYRFAIPPDAALQRLAMYVDGKLTESAVVERQRARRIYEELVYRRIDPALLEWAGTGRLSLRVYPLPARQDKRLMLAYTQSLPKLYSDWTLSVPLPEIDQPVGEVAFDVTIKGCANCEVTSTSHKVSVQSKGEDALVTYSNKSETIGDSLVLHVRDKRQEVSLAKHDDYLMVRTPAELPRDAKPYRPRTWVILDDVSASRGAMERRAQADLIDAFMHELDEEDKVAVLAFDVTARQKLAMTRVLDVDRRKLRASLKTEGNVGATDFSVALEAANKLLAGVAPDDAMLVYIGDGVITSGPKNLDALRAQLVGKVHFVGVGVGDGPDTQTLETLAAATGGYSTTIDLADDVAWRAFDLIAALHTARVTGVEARLLDDKGAHVPSTLYMKSPQLADGEELELVAKLAGGGTPAAVELTGTLNGTKWTKTIALPDKASDGGYLPRTWAQRHIAARMLAKHEAIAVTPCTPGPKASCPTEAEVREKRDEAIRQEVVGLGKKYFLLSRHTSLLVLENDAMYQQYGVAKGAGDTWAPYVLPATIPVITTAPLIKPSNVADDAELTRNPIPVFYNYGYGNGYFAAGLDDGEWGGLTIDGRFGTIGGGSGYGVGGTRGTRGDLGLATIPLQTQQAHAGPTVPDTGAVASVVTESTLEANKERDSDRWAGGEEKAKRQSISSDEIVGGFGRRGGGIGSTGWLGNERESSRSQRYWSGPMVAQRFASPTDMAFDDMTAFVPALLADSSDTWRARLTSLAGAAKAHPIDDAAKTLLRRARAALPTGVYRWNDLEIAVDSSRKVGWRRTTDADLAETASFDGTTFTRRYSELGLDVSRTLTADAVAFSLAYLPLWIAEPEHYARWFDVKASGRIVSLSSAGKVVFSLELDAKEHLSVIRDGAGAELIRITWGDAGPVSAKVAGQDVSVGFTGQAIGDAVAWAHGTTNPGVSVELPAHLPAYWEAKIKAETAGSAAWRNAQRQAMVSYAAVNNRSGLNTAYEALRNSGGVELGDLVLASAGIATSTTDAQLATALATLSDTPVAKYLIAGRTYGKSPRPERLAPQTGSMGLVAAVWQLRHVTALFAASQSKAAVDALVAMGPRALQLRIIGAAAISSRHDVKPEDIGRAWDAVAVGEYKNVARAQAAIGMANRNAIDAAVERVSMLIADLDLRARPPQLDQLVYRVQQSRRGPAGWQLIWTAWRDKVLAGNSYEHVMSLISIANQQRADLPSILNRAVELAGGDVDRKLTVARIAVQYGMPAFAQNVIAPLLTANGTRELYQLAAALELQQGRTADALGHLEAAQAASADEPVAIGTVRAELAQIIQVARELAVQSSGPARDATVKRAMAWGAKWRAIDPGNPDIDTQLGELQLAVG
ncbi:MAG: FecR domain-containing protein, partial [Deltaproteobacteria bacterium]|nr:FecR domain-containing protein [Deltaproteobacteria bacterium]